MTNQNNNAPVASKNRPFALICDFEVPTTELDPDLIPHVKMVIGYYETLEECKQARQAIDSPMLISAGLYHSFESNASDAVGGM